MYIYVVRTLVGEVTLTIPSEWETPAELQVEGDFRAVPGLVSLVDGAATPFGHVANITQISPADLEYVLDRLVAQNEFLLGYDRLAGTPALYTSAPKGTTS